MNHEGFADQLENHSLRGSRLPHYVSQISHLNSVTYHHLKNKITIKFRNSKQTGMRVSVT